MDWYSTNLYWGNKLLEGEDKMENKRLNWHITGTLALIFMVLFGDALFRIILIPDYTLIGKLIIFLYGAIAFAILNIESFKKLNHIHK